MKIIIKDKNGETRIIWILLLSLIMFFVSIFGMNLIFLNLFPSNKILGYALYAISSCIISIFGTQFISRNAFKKERIKFIDFNLKQATLKNISKGFLFGFFLSVIWILSGFIIGEFNIRYNGFNVEVFVVSFLAYLAVGVAEECTFRGLIDTAFSKFGPLIGIFASAIIFASLHSEEGLSVFLERVAMGVLFSILMRKTNSLSFVIGVHIFYNFSLTAIIGLEETGSKTLFSTLVNSTSHFWVGSSDDGSPLLIIIALIISIILFLNKKKKIIG